jgi:hypothetical protein
MTTAPVMTQAPQWFSGLLCHVYKDMELSLQYFWPSTDKWPHENIILVSLVRYAKEIDAFLYPECSLKTPSGNIRRDAILISHKLRLVMQCEFKHFWQYDPVIRDLERIGDASVLDTFLRGGGVPDEVFDYDWYGLFLGFGHIHNSCREMWKSAENNQLSEALAAKLPEHEKQKLESFVKIQRHTNSNSGIITTSSQDVPEKKQFWLAYYLRHLEK